MNIRFVLFFITNLIFGINSLPTEETPSSSSPDSMCPCPKNQTEHTTVIPLLRNQSPVHEGSTTFSTGKVYHAMLHGTPCVCHIEHALEVRDDYKYTIGLGAHKLHTRAATWNEARKSCNEEGAHLAIINSNAEAQVLIDLFKQAGTIKGATYEDVAYLGIHDLYKEGEWVTILGDSLYKTGYTKWSDKWGGQPDNGSGKQNCGVLLKEGGLDDVFCDVPFAFFCELPPIKYLR